MVFKLIGRNIAGLSSLTHLIQRKMKSNLEKYKAELETLIDNGASLFDALQYECLPKEFEEYYKKKLGDKYGKFIEMLPRFSGDFQKWYSEAHAVVKQLIPDRLPDFVRLYEKPKN